jgi:outer membrane protein TolC
MGGKIMKKNLSLLIALAISLSTSTISFAADANNNTSTPANSSVQADNSTLNLTMNDAIDNIEKNNTEINLMKDKLNPLNNQYDLDHDLSISLKTDTPGINKMQVEVQQLITPLKDEQNVKNQKYAIDVRLNNIKFDTERQYLNILTCNDQIDNINKTLTNIDEQIKKLQEQINLGLATADSLDTLNVQKSQLMTQIDSINASIDNSMLIIKQYLNIDLNRNLILTASKKDFVKFDDTNIEDQIKQALQKDYGISEAQLSIDLADQQKKIYTQLDNDSSGNLSNAESSLLSAQNALVTTNVSAKSNLLNKYYTLKSDENAVETQVLSEQSAQADYDKAKSNYDNGMIDKVTLDTTALALDKQKNLDQRATNEYMIIQEEFKYMLDGHASAQPSTQSIGISGIGY